MYPIISGLKVIHKKTLLRTHCSDEKKIRKMETSSLITETLPIPTEFRNNNILTLSVSVQLYVCNIIGKCTLDILYTFITYK